MGRKTTTVENMNAINNLDDVDKIKAKKEKKKINKKKSIKKFVITSTKINSTQLIFDKALNFI